MHQVGLDVFDMRFIDEEGMRATMQQALYGMTDNTHLHVSFDVDFLDPRVSRRAWATVAGGLTARRNCAWR